MFQKWLIICSVFAILAIAEELRCYDCLPEDAGKCKNPIGDNIKTSTCSLKIYPRWATRATTDNETQYSCLSLYFTPSTNTSRTEGTYRGCINIKNACQRIDTELKSGNIGTISDCKLCNDNECNSSEIGHDSSTYALIFSFFIYLFIFKN